MTCRHRKSWLIAGGSYEWCYECGAIRNMQESGIAQVRPISPWCKPVGRSGANPWGNWFARKVIYQKRHVAPQREDTP